MDYLKRYYQKNKDKIQERSSKYYQSLKHKPMVYYLPEEHYVGITECWVKRKITHKKKNRYVEDMEVICYCDRMVDAMFIVIQFHQRGYNGFNYKKRTK